MKEAPRERECPWGSQFQHNCRLFAHWNKIKEKKKKNCPVRTLNVAVVKLNSRGKEEKEARIFLTCKFLFVFVFVFVFVLFLFVLERSYGID